MSSALITQPRDIRALALPLTHPVAAYLLVLSAGSRYCQRSALRAIAVFLGGDLASIPWHELTNGHLMAVRAWLAETRAPGTANRYMCALRGVMLAARRQGLISRDAHADAVDVPPIRGTRLPKGRALDDAELDQLTRSALQDSFRSRGLRNAAIMALLYGAGLRRAELCALDLASYDVAARTLKVHGKGNKERLVPLPDFAIEHLTAWIAHRGNQPGPLVHALQSRTTARLQHDSIYGILVDLAERAGVTKFMPHDLRRTFISDLIDRGADLRTVQGLVGHENIQTTASYDRRGFKARRAAVALLVGPGRVQTSPTGAPSDDARSSSSGERA